MNAKNCCISLHASMKLRHRLPAVFVGDSLPCDHRIDQLPLKPVVGAVIGLEDQSRVIQALPALHFVSALLPKS